MKAYNYVENISVPLWNTQMFLIILPDDINELYINQITQDRIPSCIYLFTKMLIYSAFCHFASAFLQRAHESTATHHLKSQK